MEWEGSQLVLIRHAPMAGPGILCGRTDLPARIDDAATAPLAVLFCGVGHVVTSPAQRCRQTARAIWPEPAEFDEDARLWEQDFGDHDGRRYSDLPDLGMLTNAELAAHRPPRGESFDDLCTRVFPALDAWAERARDGACPVALVVHAGVIRGALARAIGNRPAALAFEIAPLAVTRLRVGPDGPVSVIETNRVHA